MKDGKKKKVWNEKNVLSCWISLHHHPTYSNSVGLTGLAPRSKTVVGPKSGLGGRAASICVPHWVLKGQTQRRDWSARIQTVTETNNKMVDTMLWTDGGGRQKDFCQRREGASIRLSGNSGVSCAVWGEVSSSWISGQNVRTRTKIFFSLFLSFLLFGRGSIAWIFM